MARLNSFVAGGIKFIPVALNSSQPFTKVNIQRKTNASSPYSGNWFNGFYRYTSNLFTSNNNAVTDGSTYNNNTDVYLEATEETTMENLINNFYISYGVDNLFGNTGDGGGSVYSSGLEYLNNGNNIERVDLVYQPGIGATTASSRNRLGFLVNERNGNDAFYAAAITGIDGAGNVTALGTLLNITSASWGGNGPSFTYFVLAGPTGGTLRPAQRGGSQQAKGMFISLANLGIPVNQKVYGIALFPPDFVNTPATNSVTLGSVIYNTSQATGGIDLMAANILARDTTNFDVWAQTLSGKVWNDANGNGIDDGASESNVSGTNVSSGGSVLPGGSLYVNIVDVATGNVVAVVPVNADGTYNYTGMLPNYNYRTVLTTAPGTIGSPIAAGTPGDWQNTGENLDGVLDAITPGIVNFTSPAGTDLNNYDFGIQSLPNSIPVSQAVTQPSGGTIPPGAITAPVSGTDFEDGPLGNSNTIVITKLPVNGVLYYNGSPVTLNQVIVGFNPQLLSFTGLQSGTMSTVFEYAFRDAAGKIDPSPVTYTVSWPTALPVVFGALSAKISDGMLIVNWESVLEVNNDHFDIEASADGLTFLKIGEVKSKATGGNSSATLSYHFSRSATEGVLGSIGWTLVILSFVFFCYKPKKTMILLPLLAMGLLATYSCNKHQDALPENGKNKLFVRIVQSDVNGIKAFSKTVQVQQ